LRELGVVRVEDRLAADRVVNDLRHPHAIATPSYVDVPRPSSSRSTRLRAVAPCRIALVSLISTMNVDWPRARLSDAPTRVNSRSTTPTMARRAGTNAPICASTTHRPTCRSNVDLPAMFG